MLGDEFGGERVYDCEGYRKWYVSNSRGLGMGADVVYSAGGYGFEWWVSAVERKE